MPFAHEKLQVYQKGLESFGSMQPLLSSWSKQHAFVDHLSRASESGSTYSTVHPDRPESSVFHHESLDMYRATLCFYRWFLSTEPGKRLASGCDRSVDVLATRVTLNIAEGNGRYAELSRQGFLDTANAAVAKLAVCLDIGVRRKVWTREEIEEAKLLLLRIGQMTAKKD